MYHCIGNPATAHEAAFGVIVANRFTRSHQQDIATPCEVAVDEVNCMGNGRLIFSPEQFPDVKHDGIYPVDTSQCLQLAGCLGNIGTGDNQPGTAAQQKRFPVKKSCWRHPHPRSHKFCGGTEKETLASSCSLTDLSADSIEIIPRGSVDDNMVIVPQAEQEALQ